MKPRKFILAAAASIAALATASHAAVIVSTGATTNENCSAGVCTPTAKDAVLNSNDLANMLATSDVVVKTDAKAKNILINAAFNWVSANRLTLDAYQSIKVQQVVTVAGPGGLTLITNDGGTGGDYSFVAPGYITFWDLGSSLVINGKSFTLVGNIKTLAARIKASPSGNFAFAAGKDFQGMRIGTAVPTEFDGIFTGLGNTLSNLQIGQGFFSDTRGVARDIRFSLITVRAHRGGDSTAILALENDGLAENVFVSASGPVRNFAGLVDLNVGTIRNCHAALDIHASKTFSGAAGLVRENQGTIAMSSASGDIGVGIERAHVGGLVVFNSGSISQSFSTVNVSTQAGASTAGGLAGESGGVSAVISDSYATGSVTSSPHAAAGGLIGLGGTAVTSYSTGAVANPSARRSGGLIGVGGTASNSYWDIDTSGQSKSAGGTGLTDTQLKSGLPAGFDPAVWGQDPGINNGWPYLLANPPQ